MAVSPEVLAENPAYDETAVQAAQGVAALGNAGVVAMGEEPTTTEAAIAQADPVRGVG
jgi:hypothetical protein